MNDHDPQILELLPAFALGTLDRDEKLTMNAHLAAGCAECDAQINSWRRDVAELGLATHSIAPSAALRSRILASVQQPAEARPAPATAPPAPVRRRLLVRGLPWAALLAIAIWSALRQMTFTQELERTSAARDQAKAQASVVSHQLADARAAVGRMERTLAVVSAPNVQSIQLAGLGPTPSAAGRTFVNRDAGRAMFYAFNLPQVASDKTYELWFITAGGPVAAGTFLPDSQGIGGLEVDRIAAGPAILAWAVTIEPRPGVSKPTGAMVLKG
jgi:hypothetical protein